jgi:hypothetical protein
MQINQHAQLAALNLKANLASPTFTGTGGITKAMVGLTNRYI